MRWTLQKIAGITGGRIEKDDGREIEGVASLAEAGAGDLSFVQDASRYEEAKRSEAEALLCSEPLPWFDGPQIVVPDPKLAMASVLEAIEKETFRRAPGVSEGASVHPSARIGAEAFVAPGAVVEEEAEVGEGAEIHAAAVVERRSRIGPGTRLLSGAKVAEGVRVGARCVVGEGSCLGSAGFGVQPLPDGSLRSIPQVGTVIVEDEVEIGALCTVDRGTLGPTVIGEGTKMDNHCHVAHNVHIGKRCLLVAFARIAGSTVLEDGVTLAEDVGVTDNVKIGRGARVGGGSRVFKSVPAGAEVWGAPAKPLAEERRLQAMLRRLPDLREKVRALWRKR